MTRRQKQWWRKNWLTPVVAVSSFYAGFFVTGEFILRLDAKAAPDTLINPFVEATPAPQPVKRFEIGKASWYSMDGCIGCRADRLMANGEVLDDTRATVAYNRAALNTYLQITNTDNGKTVTAKVTDRGGFERHGKIIDLTIATRDSLDCPDVCNVKVEEI